MKRRRSIATRLKNVEKALVQILERLDKLEGCDVASGLIGFAIPSQEHDDYEGSGSKNVVATVSN